MGSSSPPKKMCNFNAAPNFVVSRPVHEFLSGETSAASNLAARRAATSTSKHRTTACNNHNSEGQVRLTSFGDYLGGTYDYDIQLAHGQPPPHKQDFVTSVRSHSQLSKQQRVAMIYG